MERKYNIPMLNPELLGKAAESSQYWAVEGYLKGLKDAGLIEKLNIEHNGKGANSFDIQFNFPDLTVKTEQIIKVNKTLTERYKAISK